MFFLLFMLWILLSGKVTLEVCLTGALGSALLSYFGRKVLGYGSLSKMPTIRKLWDSLLYLFFLLWEILKAGLVVMKLIYTKGKHTQPELVYFHSGLKSNEARAALADSITLTAGTITVLAEGDVFCVHALDKSLAAGIENSKFAQRLKKLER